MSSMSCIYKFIGAFFIAAGSVALGITPIMSLKRHIALLEALCASLRITAAELGTRLRPLPELISELSERGGAAGGFYADIARELDSIGEKDFSGLWSAALDKLQFLSIDERETMNELGAVLGRYELQEQLDSIGLCLDVLSRKALELRTEYPERRRLILGLSAAAGFTTLIVLI